MSKNNVDSGVNKQYGGNCNYLIEEAKKLTEREFPVIPLLINESKKTPVGCKWTTRRDKLATENELKLWYGNNPNNGHNSSSSNNEKTDQNSRNKDAKANGIAVAINKSKFAVDTDGMGELIFIDILARLAGHIKDKILSTMRTKTPHGNHRTFDIDPKEFPNGVDSSDSKYNLKLDEHNEIKIIGNRRLLYERGPGYEEVKGPESIVTLSKPEVKELFDAISLVKKETDVSRIVAEIWRPFYYQPHRNDQILYMSGYLFRGGTSLNVAKKIASRLVEITKYPDEDLDKIYRTIETTYSKDPESDEVNGYNKLLEAFETATPAELKAKAPNTAANIIDQIERTLNKFGFFKPVIGGKGIVDPLSGSDADNNDGLPKDIAEILQEHIYKIISYDPQSLVVAHKYKKEILRARVDYTEKNAKGDSTIKYKAVLQWKGVVIDAIPSGVIINENPLDGTKTYQIKFVHSNSDKPLILGPGNAKTIIADLQDRGRYVDSKDAERFLMAILTVYEDKGFAQISDKVLQPGYYYVDNKIVGYDVAQKLDGEISKDDCLKCIQVIDGLIPRFKRPELIPTIIKWAIVAPFSYVRKCNSLSGSNWQPWLDLYGRRRTGKNTCGVIALAVQRKHLLKDKSFHQLGVGNIDSPPRFGKTVSRSTLSVMMSEVNLTEDKLRWLIEYVKHAVENPTVRGRYIDKNRYEDIQALSAGIITSNHRPPKDGAFLERMVLINFSKKDDTTAKQKEEFEKWLMHEGRIDLLGVLGDFAAQYVIANPGVIFDHRWEESAKIIITEFYKHAGDLPPPSWLPLQLRESISDQSDQETQLELRAFFVNRINKAYSAHYRTLSYAQQEEAKENNGNQQIIDPEDPFKDTSIWSRLEFCLKYRLITFLHRKTTRILFSNPNEKKETIIITSDIMEALKEDHIENVATLQDIADEMDFEYNRNIKLKTGKTISGVIASRESFVSAIDSEFADIEENLEENT